MTNKEMANFFSNRVVFKRTYTISANTGHRNVGLPLDNYEGLLWVFAYVSPATQAGTIQLVASTDEAFFVGKQGEWSTYVKVVNDILVEKITCSAFLAIPISQEDEILYISVRNGTPATSVTIAVIGEGVVA